MHDIKLVNQQCDKSCVVACIAMVANRSFNEVRKLFKDMPVNGLGASAALARFGYIHRPELYREIYNDKVYIIGVPSINIETVMHGVVLDTRIPELYDPQKGREGKKYYTYDDLKCWGDVSEIIDSTDILKQ